MEVATDHFDRYERAMQITDQAEADAYTEACISHVVATAPGFTREFAGEAFREILGTWTAFHDNETAVRVQKLFRCKHPIFGEAVPGRPICPGKALATGIALGVNGFSPGGGVALALAAQFTRERGELVSHGG